MKWLSKLTGLVLGFMALGTIRDFLLSNRFLILSDEDANEDFEPQEHVLAPKNISDLKPDYTNSMDLRGTPTHICVCGCYVWNLKVVFNQGQIDQYFLDMECAQCGSLATAPTPIDNRNELD